MLNHWVGIGNLCADPELRYTQGAGKAVTTLRLAVNDSGNDKALFVTVICWERVAEAVANHTQKGSRVAVVGRWTQREYEAQDGLKRTIYEVQASQVRFLDRKGGNSGGDNTGEPSKPNSMGGEPQFDESDEIPF